MPTSLRRVLQLALVDCGDDAGHNEGVDTAGLGDDAARALEAVVFKSSRPRRHDLDALLDAYGVKAFDVPLDDITPQEAAAATVVVDTAARNALHVGIVRAADERDGFGFWMSRATEYPGVWAAIATDVVGASPGDMYGAAADTFDAQLTWEQAAATAVQPVVRYLRGLSAYCFMQHRILTAALPRNRLQPLLHLHAACKWLQRQADAVFGGDTADARAALRRAVRRYTRSVRALRAAATYERGDGGAGVAQTYHEVRHAWRTLTGMARLNRKHAGVMFAVRAKLHSRGDTRGVALLDRMFGRQWSAYMHALTRSASSNPGHALRRVGFVAYRLPPLRGMHAGYARLADDDAVQLRYPLHAVQGFLDEHQDDATARDVTVSRLAATSPLLLTTLLPRGDALPPDALYEFDSLRSVRTAQHPSAPPELRRLFDMLPRSEELWACLDSVLARCRAAALRGVDNFDATVHTNGMDEASRRVLLRAYCKQHGMPYALLRDLDAQRRGVPLEDGDDA